MKLILRISNGFVKSKEYKITENEIEIVTEPQRRLWQRTYYHLGMIMRLFWW